MTREQKLEEALRGFLAVIRAEPSFEYEKCDIIGPLLRQADAALTAGEEAGVCIGAWRVEWWFKKGEDVSFAGGGSALYEKKDDADKHVAKLSEYEGTDRVIVTPLYAHPTPSPIVDDAMLDRASWAEAYYRDRPRHIWLSEILNAALSGAREGGE